VATAWERIKVMLKTFPSHGMDEWNMLLFFYNGLNYMLRSLLDSTTGGAFMTNTVSEAKPILENMLQNHSQWYTKRVPNTLVKKVNSIEEVHNLNAKIDALMAMVSKLFVGGAI
jgi:hypothetical protein